MAATACENVAGYLKQTKSREAYESLQTRLFHHRPVFRRPSSATPYFYDHYHNQQQQQQGGQQQPDQRLQHYHEHRQKSQQQQQQQQYPESQPNPQQQQEPEHHVSGHPAKPPNAPPPPYQRRVPQRPASAADKPVVSHIVSGDDDAIPRHIYTPPPSTTISPGSKVPRPSSAVYRRTVITPATSKQQQQRRNGKARRVRPQSATGAYEATSATTTAQLAAAATLWRQEGRRHRKSPRYQIITSRPKVYTRPKSAQTRGTAEIATAIATSSTCSYSAAITATGTSTATYVAAPKARHSQRDLDKVVERAFRDRYNWRAQGSGGPIPTSGPIRALPLSLGDTDVADHSTAKRTGGNNQDDEVVSAESSCSSIDIDADMTVISATNTAATKQSLEVQSGVPSAADVGHPRTSTSSSAQSQQQFLQQHQQQHQHQHVTRKLLGMKVQRPQSAAPMRTPDLVTLHHNGGHDISSSSSSQRSGTCTIVGGDLYAKIFRRPGSARIRKVGVEPDYTAGDSAAKANVTAQQHQHYRHHSSSAVAPGAFVAPAAQPAMSAVTLTPRATVRGSTVRGSFSSSDTTAVAAIITASSATDATPAPVTAVSPAPRHGSDVAWGYSNAPSIGSRSEAPPPQMCNKQAQRTHVTGNSSSSNVVSINTVEVANNVHAVAAISQVTTLARLVIESERGEGLHEHGANVTKKSLGSHGNGYDVIRAQETVTTGSLSPLGSTSGEMPPSVMLAPLTRASTEFCSRQELHHLQGLMLRLKNSSRSSMEFYRCGKVIGEGSFAKVRIGWHRLTGQQVAIKTYERAKIKDAGQWKRIQQEVKLMERLNHPRVVRLFETIESSRSVHLVMELSVGGNLCSYVKRKKRLDEHEARRIFDHILQGVEYMHELDIIHRDIKLENVLFDAHKNAKLVDFGFSAYCGGTSKDSKKLLHVLCGTPSYMAPEIIKRTQYKGKPVDVWSMGVVLYAMLCGCFPFSAESYPELYKKTVKGIFRLPEWLSASAADLIRHMLLIDPVKRYTLKEVRAHPWLQNFTSSSARHNATDCSRKLFHISADPSQDISRTIMLRLDDFGFSRGDVTKQLIDRRHGCLMTTYYLMRQALQAEQGASRE